MLGHEVCDPELPGDPGVEHLKLVQVVHDPVLPGDLLFVHQHGHQGGGKGLGGGADLEDGVFINLIVPAHFFDPKALGKDNLIVLDDGDGHAGHLPVLLGPLGVILEVGQNLFELLGGRLFTCSAPAWTEEIPPAVRQATRVNMMKNRVAICGLSRERWP